METSNTPLIIDQEEKLTKKHIKKIVVSGIGFFSDAYDLFIINIVMVIISREHTMTNGYKSAVSAAALWGAVLGQLFFGMIADRIGRKKGFIATLSLVITGALLSACSFETATTSIYISLAIFRFILGVGIGGEYPLSATITAESATTETRGRLTALVFSMQGVGSLVASLTAFLLIISTNNPQGEPEQGSLDLVWRICLALGAVPGILTMYFRVTMEETERFAAKKSEVKHQSIKDKLRIIKSHWRTLLGTAGSWFLFDIVFYANGLFSATVLQLFEVGESGASNSMKTLESISEFNIYLALIALPGYWAGVYLIELKYTGRRNTQIGGFVALAILYTIIGLIYKSLLKYPGVFIALYGLSFFICNAGPNTTTFVLPSESFPTETRATCHGISAASGKLGAVLGASMMAPILNSYGLPSVLYICSVVSVLGAILTWYFVVETRGRSLEQVSNPSHSIAEDRTDSFELLNDQ